MCNITIIYLPTSPMCCFYTTLGNTGRRYDRAKLHVDAQKLMPFCQDAQAAFSSILALRSMAVIIATSYWCSSLADAAIHSFHCWWCLRIPAIQCTSASCASDGLPQGETPKFIVPDLWPPNSPDLNPIDYRIWGAMQDGVYQTPVRDVTDLKQHLTYTWNGLS